MNTQNKKDILSFPFNGGVRHIRTVSELIIFIGKHFPDMKLLSFIPNRHSLKQKDNVIETVLYGKYGQGLVFIKEGACFKCYYPPFGNAEPFTELLNVIGLKAVQK